NLNLDDMFFRYGFRINHDLAKDIQSAIIPVNTELEGNAPRFTPAPWYYFPLLSNNPDHPATRGLNLVYSRFASTIDSVGTRPSLEKTVLLHTSEMSKTIDVPAVVSLEEIRNTPTRKEFNQSNLPVAVLIEGTFESVFRNRMLSALDIKGEYRFKEESKPTSMLVVADGNIIGNDVRYTPGGPQITPLGYDKYSRQTFGNKEFIVNVMNFITGNKGLIQLRNRDFKLRLLDESKIKNNKLEWQLVNALLPVLIIIFIGLLLTYYRKRQYTIKF
ncbi:MAG: Gldg family protein, partial [bacterium]